MKNKLQRILIVSVMMATVACGQNMSTQKEKGYTKGQADLGPGDAGGGYSNVPFDYQSLEKQSLDEAAETELAAKQAAAEAEKALQKISLGRGGISIGAPGEMDSQLVVDKIVEKLLNKVVKGLKKAPEKFDMIRARLAVAMSKLDANNPLHQRAMDALMRVMAQVDVLEAKYKDLVLMVADKVLVVSDRLSSLASAVPFPASIFVQIELNDVQQVLRNFREQVRNL